MGSPFPVADKLVWAKPAREGARTAAALIPPPPPQPPHPIHPHKNLTVYLNPRMCGMCHSLIGMKQSVERQGGALFPSQRPDSARTTGPEGWAAPPILPGPAAAARISKAALCIERDLVPRVPGRRREEGHRWEAVPSQCSSGWCSQGPWPGEDGAHMGGCFCIPWEPSLSWGPGEFPGGPRPVAWLRWWVQ